MFDYKTERGSKMMGYTFDGDKYVCDKCGEKISSGIANISTHWNDCIDSGRLKNALIGLREEKGEELTIEDLDKVL